jgi:hypothetical protein
VELLNAINITITMSKKNKEEIETPIIPEQTPHRKIEEPTEPNRQVPEREPQKEKEKENFPPPTVPEHKPQRTIEEPTELKP